MNNQTRSCQNCLTGLARYSNEKISLEEEKTGHVKSSGVLFSYVYMIIVLKSLKQHVTKKHKQMANKLSLTLKAATELITLAPFTPVPILSSPHHHHFLIFSISSELSRCLFTSLSSIFVSGAAIGWYTKWIIQPISPCGTSFQSSLVTARAAEMTLLSLL